jgi:hypothetical protein
MKRIMSKQFWKPLLTTPALLSAAVVMATIAGTTSAVKATETTAGEAQALAADSVEAPSARSESSALIADASAVTDQPVASTAPLNQLSGYSTEGEFAPDGASQVTSVSQLSDVQPTDWAFQALQSLVERYGCIVGYPDRTYRGNRALTRYEFAAGLNACMDRINELIAAGTADLVKKEDLLAVQKLQEEFAAELATLRGRVDALDARTATLEKQQFSTTTKLTGEVIFMIADTFGDRATRTGNGSFLGGVTAGNEATLRDDQTETIFANRVRLALDTSFTGRDRLRTRLQARNITPFNNFTGTNQTRLGVDGLDNPTNSVLIDKLFYRFPLGNKLTVQIDAVNSELQDTVITTLSPFESSGSGAVSRFGRFNPFYRGVNSPGSPGSAGITFAYKFNNALRLEGGYLSGINSNDPAEKRGLFNGSQAALAQVVFSPNPAFTVALAYAHSYYAGGGVNLTGSTGTGYAANPFAGVATTADSVSGAVQFRLSPRFIVGGWASASFAHRRSNSDNATILSALGYVALPDFGKKGNLAALLFGIAPTVIDTDFVVNPVTGLRRDDRSTPFHLEAFYRYRLTDNIALTPGLFVLFNPEGNSANAVQYVGVLRTTFTF